MCVPSGICMCVARVCVKGCRCCIPGLCPHPAEGAGPSLQGCWQSVTVCLCREAGGRAARQSVSVSQPVWGRLRGGGGLPHAPEHVRACRSDGLQGGGGGREKSGNLPCPCHPLLRTCSPASNSGPLAPAHHRAPPWLCHHFSVGIDFAICALVLSVPRR